MMQIVRRWPLPRQSPLLIAAIIGLYQSAGA
jgi:hypothetical protein